MSHHIQLEEKSEIHAVLCATGIPAPLELPHGTQTDEIPGGMERVVPFSVLLVLTTPGFVSCRLRWTAALRE